jgi:hypothetical protein
MEKNPSYGQKTDKIPQAPPLHEEPLRGVEPGRIACEICGKTFVNSSALDRHLTTEHEMDEEKE